MRYQVEKHKKLKSEITVRISIAFQDAPNVHTLFAMTPVRERGRLILHALENYIRQTEHPAGNVDTQLEMIANWLKARSEGEKAELKSGNHFFYPTNINIIPEVDKSTQPKTHPLPQQNDEIKFTESNHVSIDTTQSQSINRWLGG